MKTTSTSNGNTTRPVLDHLVERLNSADAQVKWASARIEDARSELYQVLEMKEVDQFTWETATGHINNLHPQLLAAVALARNFTPHLSVYEAMQLIQNNK